MIAMFIERYRANKKFKSKMEEWEELGNKALRELREKEEAKENSEEKYGKNSLEIKNIKKL